MMETRVAILSDAEAMSDILAEIIADWGSDRRTDVEHVTAHYLQHPDLIQCTVAENADGEVVGFQVLKLATAGNVYDLPLGWGIIGSYVRLDQGGQGIGQYLFAATKQAAIAAGLTKIDATIGKDNTVGLYYYEKLGFRTYRELPAAIGKCYVC